MKPGAVGIGLRAAHHDAFLAQRPPVDFVEVHAENFMTAGGAARALLSAVREQVPISLHGVSLGLGSAVGIDAEHLRKLGELVETFDPLLVSDHACFCRATLPGQTQVVHSADLLPLAFNEDSLAILTRNVDQVQHHLQRPILVENLSAYLRFDDDTLTETAFLGRLCRHSGCGLLLDVNNLVVNALNAEADDPVRAACEWLDALAMEPGVHVGEIHLAGHRPRQAHGALVIDDHSQPVNPTVCQVHDHARRYWPQAPRLVEWDVDLPDLEGLLAQAWLARDRP